MPLILGAIVIWSGTIENIPSGWALCNGQNGTLDLQNRFILGAGDLYAVGSTGGSADATLVSHNHTGSTNTVAGHTHVGALSTTGAGGGVSPWRGSTVAYNGGTGGYNHSHTMTFNSTGTSGTNANLPPYYALAFIQEIQ